MFYLFFVHLYTDFVYSQIEPKKGSVLFAHCYICTHFAYNSLLLLDRERIYEITDE